MFLLEVLRRAKRKVIAWVTEQRSRSQRAVIEESLRWADDNPLPARGREEEHGFPVTEFPFAPDHVTLAFGKRWLRERIHKGAPCPLCTQLAKEYSRKITSTMAYALILIYRHSLTRPESDPWFHVPEYLTKVCTVGPTVRGGDWAKLTAWGLIEEQEGEREDGSSRTGFYRITERGGAFARGEVTLPKYVVYYDGHVLRTIGDPVTVSDALGTRFNYRELMQGPVDV